MRIFGRFRALTFFPFLIALLLSPIIVYIFKFGSDISADHRLWSEMGSAMSGIYSPLLATLTLFLVARQIEIQCQVRDHDRDRANIENSREDINFYIEQLDHDLRLAGCGARESLQAFNNNFVLDSDFLEAIADNLNREYPRIGLLWAGVCGALSGLGASDKGYFQVAYRHQIIKIQTMLQQDMCVALDHYAFYLSKTRLMPFHFSPTLSKVW